jgi:hypothetical protein
MNEIIRPSALPHISNGNLTKTGSRMPAKGGRDSGGVALIDATLTEHGVMLELIHQYVGDWASDGGHVGADEFDPQVPQKLERAKHVHRRWLRDYARIRTLDVALDQILILPRNRVDQGTAVRMITVLFSALGKKKSSEEDATLLSAAADMFSPISDTIANATGLWEPISKHPLILAIAIKKLIATAKFTSAAELREAMEEVRRTLEKLSFRIDQIRETIERADAIVFETDREAWAAAYRDVDISTVERMLARLFHERPLEENDEGPAVEASPRWAALNEMLVGPEPKPKRLAAASKRRSDAKRSSRKQKGDGQ